MYAYLEFTYTPRQHGNLAPSPCVDFFIEQLCCFNRREVHHAPTMNGQAYAVCLVTTRRFDR